MRECLPPQLLKEKLPRFLQKCAQTFQTDRRYSNDTRYLRVWLQLMDFVDDPKTILRTMEANHIGSKKALFYQAYALYYEKLKKFDAAEKMYHLGVQNLAEPVDELQKSYEQFLHRLKHHNNKRNQGGKTTTVLQPSTEGKKLLPLASGHWMLPKDENHVHVARNVNNTGISCNSTLKKRPTSEVGCRIDSQEIKTEDNNCRKFYGEDTVVVKFVDTAIIGKSDAEDARHHGLVEPTINTKEAMNAINDMFREPLELSLAGKKKSYRNQSKADQTAENALEIFVDENFDAKAVLSSQTPQEDSSIIQADDPRSNQLLQEPFQIFIDDQDNEKVTGVDETNELEQRNDKNTGDADISMGHFNGFVFPCPTDAPSECPHGLPTVKPHQAKFREDTVVYRFVGSTILDEPEVENVCHHGLVDPTVNLKEAMDDINSMFGKPIEFVRKSRPKKQEKANYSKSVSDGFLILPDDELESHAGISSNLSATNESELFEQTVCTREAMAEINKMFGMPLEF